MLNDYDEKDAPNPNFVIKTNNTPTSSLPHEILKITNNTFFSIRFFKNENNITIECNDINSEDNIYEDVLYLNNLKNLDIFSFYNNINDIFKEIKNLSEKDISLDMENNNIVLNIKKSNEIILINKNEKEKEIKEVKEIKEEKDEKDEKVVTKNKCIEPKILKKNENNLEERVKNLEEYMSYLNDNLPLDYINKIIKSLPYNNSFDYTLYKLESVFTNLPPHSIISEKGYLGLINSGIKSILKGNIHKCKFIFKVTINVNKFKNINQEMENILIIVKTMNERKFGFFFINENENNPFMVQNNNQNINNNNNNKFYQDEFNDDIDDQELNPIVTKNNNLIDIFNTSSYINNSFVFSFDHNKIYINIRPNFSIQFDNSRGCFCGSEIIQNGIERLNPTNEFIFSEIEIYEIFV